jgi:hypothetical protein
MAGLSANRSSSNLFITMIAASTDHPSRLPFAFAATCAATALALFIYSGGLPRGPGRLHVRRIAWVALSTAISICLWKWRNRPEPMVDISTGDYLNKETVLDHAEVIPQSQLFVWDGYAFDLRELKRHVERRLENTEPLNNPYLGTAYCGSQTEARVRRAVYGGNDPILAKVLPLLAQADEASQVELVTFLATLPTEIWVRSLSIGSRPLETHLTSPSTPEEHRRVCHEAEEALTP